MKKLMKKILTNKSARNVAVLSVFLMTVVSVGTPWYN
jgi:hypothetical protein